MRLLQQKSNHAGTSDKKAAVLPGIVATVTDDKKNEIYVDLDLELEPVEETPAQQPQNIPPGLAASMTKRRTRGVSDLWAALAPYLRLYRSTGSR